MLTCMRTTLVLDDQLLKKAKEAAIDRGVTVSEIVNQALRTSLTADHSTAEHFTMPTHGDPGPSVNHGPEDFWHELQSDDRKSVEG